MKIYVADTERNGKGIFTGEDIPSGGLIFLVEGMMKREPYLLELYYIGERWLGVDRETWIEPPEQNPMYFTNHSCNPNAILEDRLKVVALRQIKKDEEITIDYALTEEDPYWKMECHCAEQNCRGLIVGKAKF